MAWWSRLFGRKGDPPSARVDAGQPAGAPEPAPVVQAPDPELEPALLAELLTWVDRHAHLVVRWYADTTAPFQATADTTPPRSQAPRPYPASYSVPCSMRFTPQRSMPSWSELSDADRADPTAGRVTRLTCITVGPGAGIPAHVSTSH